MFAEFIENQVKGEAMEYRVISADNHVMEPPGTFVDRLPAALRDRAPRIRKAADGKGEGWSMTDAPPKTTFSADLNRSGGANFDEIPRGNWDGRAHIDDNLLDGIDCSIVYPGASRGVYDMADPVLAAACFSAYNDWLIDEFCGADPKRLVGKYLVPTSLERDVMIAEVTRMIKRGATGFYVPFYPERPLYDPYYDPLWAVISEANGVVGMHNFVGNVSNAPKPIEGVEWSSLVAGQTALSTLSTAGPLTYMIFTGVFERFPKLKAVDAEVNFGWVPYWIQSMLHTIHTPIRKGVDWWPKVATKHPEEYIGRNVFFSVLDDYLGFRLCKDDPVLARCGMYSTDYHHPVSVWPDSPKVIPKLTEGMNSSMKHDLLAGNAMRAYNLG